MSDLKEIVAQYKAAKERLSEAIRPAVVEAAERVFAADSGIRAITWQQYTPYFNDGEACVFGVGDPGLYFDEGHPLCPEDEDEDVYGVTLWDLEDRKSSIYSSLKEFAQLTQDSYVQSAMESAFGDHVSVTIKRDGSVEVDEYDHD